MLVHARSTPSGTTVETDVCIIGGGVAGISSGLEFAKEAASRTRACSCSPTGHIPRVSGARTTWSADSSWTTSASTPADLMDDFTAGRVVLHRRMDAARDRGETLCPRRAGVSQRLRRRLEHGQLVGRRADRVQ